MLYPLHSFYIEYDSSVLWFMFVFEARKFAFFSVSLVDKCMVCLFYGLYLYLKSEKVVLLLCLITGEIQRGLSAL